MGALAGCGDGNPVEVVFQAPFPAGGTNLARFQRRDQNCYQAGSDTTETLTLGPTALVRQQRLTEKISAHQLDSLGLPRQAGQWPAGQQLVRVQPLAADSFRISYQLPDTLFALNDRQKGVLRRYQGWYYLSTPSPGAPTRWQVARLAVTGPALRLQQFNADSLRISALDTSAVRLKRAPPRLLFTLRPVSRHAIRQVGSYAGLWVPLGNYLRVGASR